MAAINNFKSIEFTGWESDRFVRFARELLNAGVAPHVRVIGREPITTTGVDFEGQVIDAIWDGYIRAITVKTAGNIIYQVGGTNSTRPIASETVTFLQLPEEYLGEYHNDDILDKLLRDLMENPTTAQKIARSLKANIRLNNFSHESKRKIVTTISASEFVNADDSILKREIVEILGLIETPDVLLPLVKFLQDKDEQVRADVALRFRGLEPTVKNVGEGSDLGTLCIKALTESLDDPCDEVRIYSAEVLGYFYNEQAINKLVQSLAHDPHEHVRWACVIALGRTNRQDVAVHLVDALEKDCSVFVQRGAMLGLGRISLKAIEEHPNLIERLIGLLCEKIKEGPDDVKDYAVYTLGELQNYALNCIEGLIGCLQIQNGYHIKSNTTLSLTKLIEHYHLNSNYREEIETLLLANLSIESPTDWPSSAFYNWYLVGAAELSALLEMHQLAYFHYQRASKGFNNTPWLSAYYDGIGSYEFAEHLCNQSELTLAIEKLDNAIRLFEHVSTYEEFQNQSDQALSGLEFKVTLAKARQNIVQAARLLSLLVLSKEEYKKIKNSFDLAFDYYSRIDVLGLLNNGKKLSRAEADLVLSLRVLTDIGRKLVDLKQYVIDFDEEKARQLMGSIRVAINTLSKLAPNTRSITLQESSRTLTELVNKAHRYSQEEITITEAAEEFFNEAITVFGQPLPTPGVCPIIDFGKANMSIELQDSIAGDGSKTNPFLFPSNKRLVFEFTVTVHKRTKNDTLIFSAMDAPTGTREPIQEIPVYESSYSLRPVDFGILAPSRVPTQFSFGLFFQNQGCAQPAHILEIWVQVYDAKQEFTETIEQVKKKALSLKNEIKSLENKLKDLEAVRASFDMVPLDIRQDMRNLRSLINVREEQLTKMEANFRLGI